MRRAGILMHPTSLPGSGPCGDLGPGARAFLDWLAEAGCSLWQMLPLCPPGGGFSPYDSPGAFALGTHLLSLEDLVADGWLDRSQLAGAPEWPEDRVDVAGVMDWKAQRVSLAARQLAQQDPGALRTFTAAQPWALDHALYLTVTAAHRTQAGWWDLPAPLRDRDPAALAKAHQDHAPAIAEHLAAQVLVHRQWTRLREEAARRGVRLVGDVPIFVSGGGADTWAHRELFVWGDPVDGVPRPDPVAGVPPDYFSPLGQRWGNPLYDWPVHQASNFAWWSARIRAVLSLCDAVRLDHFRGFCAAWAVPADAPDATAGEWTPGPARALFDRVAADLRAAPPPGWSGEGPLPIIAEDLGVITPDVEALRDGLDLPGMKVLQFAFGGDHSHPFLPHTWTHDRWVAYTGTHDNDTLRGWYDSTDDRAADHFRRYVGRDGEEPHWQLVRPLLASIARWVILPLQDVMGLGSEARMNVPGQAQGNWAWRAATLPTAPARRLHELATLYDRVPPQPAL